MDPRLRLSLHVYGPSSKSRVPDSPDVVCIGAMDVDVDAADVVVLAVDVVENDEFDNEDIEVDDFTCLGCNM